MSKIWWIAGCVAVAVVAAFAAVWANADGVDVDAFRKSAEQPAFCKAAAPLDLSHTDELTPHKREHIVEELSEMAPEGIVEDFEALKEWYEHPTEERRDSTKDASVRVGQFIERGCDDVNIGGIRT
ncbi:hypothetical protein ACFXGT_12705 [Streptomyces sp. NPDC059352]|uniref:hypothetical protein n=1 Tax=Streptomyces sp. NPDC059352 TaxID=3346810 RepID=UPI00369E8A5E